ncbi:hypothetical protein SAMN05444004_10665 [Jannaschia faecimaris]|uniref:Uncharacterized protein n=1 Tax=Jannaschia faecimaris TaxID=1244108 RepID=A0A1H3QBN1_9RHOB|nr:hypothetical protein [Jannaschia faecimaris]SDZ10826.1 hypothetical protein SAMN05444004_10665 [Jannaschia faecimaris]
MGIEALIGGLFMVTLLAAIGLAVWSKARTEKMMREGQQPSPLARKEPDPQFAPDKDVTDPERVTS